MYCLLRIDVAKAVTFLSPVDKAEAELSLMDQAEDVLSPLVLFRSGYSLFKWFIIE
jgi:hypothetical protein